MSKQDFVVLLRPKFIVASSIKELIEDSVSWFFSGN